MIKIIRYKNRKLYDTKTGSYTSVSGIVRDYVANKVPFQILEHKTNRDLTLPSLSYAVNDVMKKKGLYTEALDFLQRHVGTESDSGLSV